MGKGKRTATLYVKNLPVDVKCQFKAHCAKRGKSMVEVVEEMMRAKIKKDK